MSRKRRMFKASVRFRVEIRKETKKLLHLYSFCCVCGRCVCLHKTLFPNNWILFQIEKYILKIKWKRWKFGKIVPLEPNHSYNILLYAKW